MELSITRTPDKGGRVWGMRGSSGSGLRRGEEAKTISAGCEPQPARAVQTGKPSWTRILTEELESGCLDDLHATGLQIRNVDDPILSGARHPVHPSVASLEAR